MLATFFLGAAALGFVVLLVQRLALSVGLGRPASAPRVTSPISIIKPLCGVDDALEENLETFRHLSWPAYEVVLGVKDRSDPAWPLACAFAVKDSRFRVVQQTTSPGLNPKVNQLVTLVREARHELILISDSNARLSPGSLEQIVSAFEDPSVGCVTQPVSGWGHRSFGALLDNFHLVSGIGAAQLGAKTLVGKDLVVGKSMALRRSALNALGGLESYADVLAEDYVIGQDLRRRGLQVRVTQAPVWNVAVDKSVKSFFDRYLRWGVIHRTAVSLPTSLGQGLLNPLPFVACALALSPSVRMLGLFVGALLLKTALDVSSAKALQCGPTGWRTLPAVLVKDTLIFLTWFNGLFSRTVIWRGNRLRVGARSRLVRPAPSYQPAHAESP